MGFSRRASIIRATCCRASSWWRPGLPRVDGEQELIRAYYEEKYTQGFAYAYLYPGMNRVVQSAGRVIRSETDVGIIVLVDKRFAHGNYASLFPSHWYERSPRELVTSDFQRDIAALLAAARRGVTAGVVQRLTNPLPGGNTWCGRGRSRQTTPRLDF